jgi:hypothetical protein
MVAEPDRDAEGVPDPVTEPVEVLTGAPPHRAKPRLPGLSKCAERQANVPTEFRRPDPVTELVEVPTGYVRDGLNSASGMSVVHGGLES